MTRTLASTALFLAMVSSPSALAQPGFTTYLIGFITRSAKPALESESMRRLEQSHAANLEAMRNEGLLLASGPVSDRRDLHSVLIFRGDEREVVDKRVADDPMMKAGVLEIALGSWIGPLGIGDEYRKWATANPGAPEKLRTYQLVLLKTVWSAERITPDEQRGHLLHMDAAVKGGKLAVAGPVLDGSDLAWVLVYSGDADETETIVASNPAVKAGKLSVDRHAWMVPDRVLPAGFKVPLP